MNSPFDTDTDDAIEQMNVREQSSLVSLETYRLHFISQMSKAKQYELLHYTADQLGERIHQVNREIKQASGMVDKTNHRLTVKYQGLLNRRTMLIDKLRKIMLHFNNYAE